jgi:hypothetical protein
MRLLSRLEADRKSGAIWYVLFRQSPGEAVLAGLHEHFPRIERSTTSSMQYDKALTQFRRRPEPPGQMLGWVCRGDPSYLDLANDRMELVPH